MMVVDARRKFLDRMAKVVAGYTQEQRDEATAHLSKTDKAVLKVRMAAQRIKKLPNA
jgi:N-acetylmuramic acid 6-phosphate (MurNAc-6-P) etherase